MTLLWCLAAYVAYRLLKFTLDVRRNVSRIKSENAALKSVDERLAAAKASGNKEAYDRALIDWADASGLAEAAMERNERRIQCSNHGCHARPQEQPLPGILEDVAAFFRRRSAEYNDLVLWTVRTLRLAKPMKPKWT